MAVICFSDTTVLINFGYLNRFDLLEALLKERAWCLTVANECEASFTYLGFTTYNDVETLFGDPLEPDMVESLNTKTLRDTMAKPGDAPAAHYGEAETITIAAARGLPAILVTDDVAARKAAARHNLTTINTWDLLKTAVRAPSITFTEQEAWQAARTLHRHRRGWPKGVGQDHADYIAWLRQT